MVLCPGCKFENRDSANFCDHCGRSFTDLSVQEKAASHPVAEGKRKFVTALFCDLSGYTSLSEKLDPEELKAIMTGIFGETARLVVKYGGFVEKFIGDGTMALFGAIESHEDDPVRAIKAALEIHELIKGLKSPVENNGQPFAMHTGINTGPVVTGGVSLKHGTHGVLGDAINVASRLAAMAKADQIVVGPETHRQTEGYFDFEKFEPTILKGKTETVQIYRVLSAKKEPVKTHGKPEFRAALIGRDSEMAQLSDAVEKLKKGKGSIISIIGDVGTGKSRLVEEFKSSLIPHEIQWFEGHCYTYTQNTTYYPLTDLLSRAWNIKEGDLLENIKNKVVFSIRSLMGAKEDIVPYVSSLYSIQHPEFDRISPESRKAGLYEAVNEIIANLCRRGPTIICIEDLHWADPSSIELLKSIIFGHQHPALFLCVSRPAFSTFTGKTQEIVLKDLKPEDAQKMVESILKSKDIPAELKNYVLSKMEGNPFYIEEIVVSLLETNALVKRNGKWCVDKPILTENIPPTVQGVISARLDRLEPFTKKILQEASVIGRSFPYDILKRTTELKEHIDESLSGLERMDLIQTKAVEPNLEYIFKHVITQEVVYNELLKKERQRIHEKTGRVMEELFQERLSDFYESLAFHYKNGPSGTKAVEYLVKSAEKSLARYALDEAHQHYKEAFNIVKGISERSKEETALLVDILIQWAVIFYRRCHFYELIDLLKDHESMVISLGDGERSGMFYARIGAAMNWSNKLPEALSYLRKALEIGEQIGNEKVIASAYTFLPWCYADLGMLDEAIECGRKAQELESYKTDPDFFRHISFYIGFARYFRGDVVESKEIGERILEFAKMHLRSECLSDGYLCLTFSDLVSGDFLSAIDNIKKSYHFALDPLIKITATTIWGMSCVAAGKYQDAQKILDELTVLTDTCHSFPHGTVAKLYSGIITVINGDLENGVAMIEEVTREYHDCGLKYRYVVCKHILGQIYTQLVPGAGENKNSGLSFLLKNFGFLIKTLPFAFKKAESHFLKAIEMAQEIGAKNLLGETYFDLGFLYRLKGQTQKGRQCIFRSVEVFEKCNAGPFLNRAREALVKFQ